MFFGQVSKKKGGISPFFTIVFESHIWGICPLMSTSSVNLSKILDVDRFMNMPSRRTKEDISLCSWLLALENSLIGLGGRGRGRKEGQGSAGDTLGW